MQLFNSHHDSDTHTANGPPPQRISSIFRGRSRSPPRDGLDITGTNGYNSYTNFFRRPSPTRSSGTSTVDSRIDKEPTIMAARKKVADAESAEKAADRALLEARTAAKAAKEHVKLLEREVLEDARRAKAKQAEAKNVSKSARSLGRHG
ncbi:hypothetical protein SERLA73DRAFT_180706 [Serpula lacrymans var. lacrymans S7.3]|uniref:Uncharacterized protein n=2 Tax=Serpula lacrymans var. lacrymans TaxID=341189 RepID=F8PW58_SERL3|nr:uncharacterized protein SERLADRAFT_466411 [Serpula lacrymans var. lacrymans S7.9]EGO00234.1 hypothetical protein SERLA73DRAFT_180706 [Serpula lacrymans var. lacrymans S7.3]EGO25791.1 hypothetical protein SERLADRAFT_466411 [Serpula lacrymans var. lacrymans S7.9]